MFKKWKEKFKKKKEPITIPEQPQEPTTAPKTNENKPCKGSLCD